MKTSRNKIIIPFFFFSLLIFLSSFSTLITAKVPPNAAIYIVYVVTPENEQPTAFHLKILVAIFGSEEAAKEALVYSYTHSANAFAAWLTPEQVLEILKQPGVLQAIPNDKIPLPGRLLHHLTIP
ncbi:subtilisin-like protease SBT3.9 [Typha angustifolia]|uniref:subtilisin-like protease SBT3.9 n=1 Tax=Typha angustifolia TaxID=59011 RepID=UPI003C2D35DC